MLKGPQSPQTLKNSLPSDIYLDKYSTNQFHDDIECKSWLEEVGLSQYCETFLANFHVGGNLLSRNRLKQVRLYHFPHMNITRYDHAKVLMEHIRHTLQFQFDSPMRRNEVSKLLNSATNSVAFPPILGADDNTPSNNHLPTQRLADLHVDGTKKRANHKSASNLRRKTFDSKAWQSITKFRRQSIIDSNQSVVLDNLREGKTEIVKEPVITKATRRYSTLVLSDDIIVDNNLISTRSSKALATAYGNMALEQNMLQQQLKKLQNDQLAYYKNIINCELANIFFVNETKRELMLFVQDVWYKLSMETGIAGYTARTGESLNIIDAYADPRFNQEMDKKTGLVTRNILCHPVRGRSGEVIGVIQMLNKKDELHFSEDDEQALGICVERVSDDLHDKFHDLLRVNERMAGNAQAIGTIVSLARDSKRSPLPTKFNFGFEATPNNQ